MALTRNSILRGQVYWVNLDPTVGSEIKKTRPAVIISNDAQNAVGKRFIVAPVISNTNKIYPFEVEIDIKGNKSKVMLDQIRTIDIQRLGAKLSHLTAAEMHHIEKAIKVALQLA